MNYVREGLARALEREAARAMSGPGGVAYQHFAEIVGVLRTPFFGPKRWNCSGPDPALSGSGGGLAQALRRNF
jgi:hypothetical protein